MEIRRIQILVLLLLTFSSPLHAVTIEGVVRDREGNGLAATVIEVYAMGAGQLELIGKTASLEEERGKPRGYYRVSVPSGRPITAICYNNDAWQPRVVKDVSGKLGDDQVINKVLLDKQGPVAFLPILEQVNQYEELYYLELQRAGPDASADKVKRLVQGKYGERILSMPDPRRVQQQPAKQQAIVAKMTSEQRRVLAGKMDKLFDLYGISQHDISEGCNLQQSRWDTIYVTADGRRMRAVVILAGRSGQYRTLTGEGAVVTGQLYNINVARDGEVTLISGNWQLGAAQGYFRWTCKAGSPTAFRGEWGYHPKNGPQGSWNGQLIVASR